MKKLLAILLSVVMMFSLVALPASASGETSDNISVEDVVEKIEDAETLLEAIFNFVHNLVHSLSEMFNFDCPFCDGEADTEEPSEPETPEEPSEPEVIIGTVANTDDLSGALAAGGVYTVEADIVADSFAVQEGIKVSFDLGGNTISGASIMNSGEIAVNGGSLEAAAAGLDNSGKAVLTDIKMNAGNAGDYAAIGREGSYTEYNNVNIVSAGGGIGVYGGKAVFNSGSVDVNSTATSGRYVFYVAGEGAELVINDGTFAFSKTLNQKRAYIYAGAGTTVIVNGGNFGAASTRSGYTAGILGDGTIIIKGGTFGFNPSAWVAEGYTAVKDGSTWTVVAVA